MRRENTLLVALLAAAMGCGGGSGGSGNNGDGGTFDDAGPLCGNGSLEAPEQCDDGTANSDSVADACRTNCRLPTCGDGVADTGEECDDGLANSDTEANACRTNCLDPVCGDGLLDDAFGEECDEGVDNSDLPNVPTCRTSCLLRGCGDGVLDDLDLELCDDGNRSDGDGCVSDCSAIEPFWECAGISPSVCDCVDYQQGAGCLDCVVYVDGDPGIATRDGLGWGTALATIQEGVDLAATLEPYCEVWVAEGVYNIYQSSVNDEVSIPNTIGIRGGFAGTETDLSQWAWMANPTVIDGTEAGNPGNAVSNTIGANGIEVLVAGFTITGATSSGIVVRSGASVTAEDCLFTGVQGIWMSSGLEITVLRATFDGLTNGAIIGGSGPTTVTDATFIGNTAQDGAAIHGSNLVVDGSFFSGNIATRYGGAINGEDVTIIGSTFVQNSSATRGGVLHSISGGVVVVDGCTFDGNTSGEGGALNVRSSVTSLTLTNSSFIGNSANIAGGAVNVSVNADVQGCFFQGNEAVTDRAGALNGLGPFLAIVGSTFDSNLAQNGVGGALNIGSTTDATIVDSVFTGNLSSTAAAVRADGPTLAVDSCEFRANVASVQTGAIMAGGDLDVTNSLFVGNDGGSTAGGIQSFAPNQLTVTNCTFADNLAGNLAAIWTSSVNAVATNCIFWSNGSLAVSPNITMNFSNYEGGWGGAGSANISLDPLFVDAAGGDYHLTAASPCLDAGDDAVAPLLDREGNPRADVVGIGAGGVLSDLGCYEYQP